MHCNLTTYAVYNIASCKQNFARNTVDKTSEVIIMLNTIFSILLL